MKLYLSVASDWPKRLLFYSNLSIDMLRNLWRFSQSSYNPNTFVVTLPNSSVSTLYLTWFLSTYYKLGPIDSVNILLNWCLAILCILLFSIDSRLTLPGFLSLTPWCLRNPPEFDGRVPSSEVWVLLNNLSLLYLIDATLFMWYLAFAFYKQVGDAMAIKSFMYSCPTHLGSIISWPLLPGAPRSRSWLFPFCISCS